MYMEVTVVCCENCMEYINKFCDQLIDSSVYLALKNFISQRLNHIQVQRVVRKLSYEFLHLHFLEFTNLQKNKYEINQKPLEYL
jgi:hypothetical protein